MSAESDTPDTGRKLTGWHVLAIFVGGFGIIFGVNFYMAYSAVSTFPGMEVIEAALIGHQAISEAMEQVLVFRFLLLESLVKLSVLPTKVLPPSQRTKYLGKVRQGTGLLAWSTHSLFSSGVPTTAWGRALMRYGPNRYSAVPVPLSWTGNLRTARP